MTGVGPKIVEFFCENDDVGERNAAEVTGFPLVSGIHRELVELLKQKLFVSIELHRFRLEREIEFVERYVALLSPSYSNHYNNHNDLEHLSTSRMSAEEKAKALQEAQNRLNGLRTRLANIGRRQQKACDVLNGSLDEIRILTSNVSVSDEPASNRFELTNATWIAALNGSLALQKIKMICEKILEIEERLEINFWMAELRLLIEKLDEEQKSVAFGLILEMACWKSFESENVFVHLTCFLLEEDDFKDAIFRCFERILVFDAEKFERYFISVRLLASVFLEVQVGSVEIRNKFAETLSAQMIKVLEYEQFSQVHWGTFVRMFEAVGSQLTADSERIKGLFESKRVLFERSTTTVVPSDSVAWQVPLLSTPPIVSSSSVRNFTVIENSIGDTRGPEGWRRQIENEIRSRMEREREEEMRRREEIERIEKALREEYEKKEAERMRQLDEKMRKMELEREEERKEAIRRQKEEEERKETIRRQKEEEERKEAIRRQKEEEERKEAIRRQKKEEERKEAIRRQKEEEEARKKQQELEKKRREAEEAAIKLEKEKQEREAQKKKKKAEEKRRREAVEAANQCTFIENITLKLYSDPNSIYNESVLNGKIIGLYFSGSWCPPSLDFTPILRDFYRQVENDFEVVFISWDNSQQQMNEYMRTHHGNWFHLQWGSVCGQLLGEHFSVNSIPTLLIFTPDGTLLERDGRGQVQINANNPQALVNLWKTHLK